MVRTLLLGFALVTVAISLSACNSTVRGAGADIERAGENIQQATPPAH